MLYNSNALKKGAMKMKIDSNSTSWLVPSFPLFIAKDDRERYNVYVSRNKK